MKEARQKLQTLSTSPPTFFQGISTDHLAAKYSPTCLISQMSLLPLQHAGDHWLLQNEGNDQTTLLVEHSTSFPTEIPLQKLLLSSQIAQKKQTNLKYISITLTYQC